MNKIYELFYYLEKKELKAQFSKGLSNFFPFFFFLYVLTSKVVNTRKYFLSSSDYFK